MLNAISAIGLNENQPKTNSKKEFATSYFNNSFGNSTDNFVPSENAKIKKQENSDNNVTIAATAIAGASFTGLGLTKAGLGKILKLVGEDVPTTIKGRLDVLLDLASKDGMTKLFNKKALMACLPRDFNNAVKNKQDFSVGMLDMDNFKSINEVFGHEVGDIFLKRIATDIQEVSKKYNVKGFRYGGEEFVITMSGQNGEKGKLILNEISDSIKNDKIIQDYLSPFKEKASTDISFINSQLENLNSILPQLRKDQPIANPEELANNINSLIEKHIAKYEPGDTSALDEIVKALKTEKPENITKILHGEIKINGQDSLGEELNKIQLQYKNLRNDLQKWAGHIDRHDMFTISGGVVSTDGSSMIKDSNHLIEIADLALKSAKENGKNTVVLANEDTIKKVLSKSTQKD